MLAAIVADCRAVAAIFASEHGGWRAAWRRAHEFAARRRILVHSQSAPEDGQRLVLRTRVRLSGDVQTDVLADWLRSAPHSVAHALITAHFAEVAAATAGWPAFAALARLGSLVTFAAGVVLSGLGVWHDLVGAWPLWLGMVAMTVGPLLRVSLRIWLRHHFRRGLV